MRIIIDAMGADNSPSVMVLSAFRAVAELDLDILLVGKESEILKVMSQHNLSSPRVKIVNADDVVEMEDEPIAVRQKPQSSLSIALNLLKGCEGDALVSAGNSGALLVGATLIVRCVKGVRRAAMAPVMPVKGGLLMIADSGANVECRPEMLEQFGVMGSVYMKKVLGISSPRVGLANNGAEECKGTELYIEAYKLLRENKSINFVGNIEGRGIPLGECDVCVCDGFTGNLILKTYEGAGKMFAEEIKKMFKKNILTMLGALFVKSGIDDLKKRMDYKEVGGAVLLGISRPVIKAHGSSDERAFFSAIKQAKNFVAANVIDELSMKDD